MIHSFMPILYRNNTQVYVSMALISKCQPDVMHTELFGLFLFQTKKQILNIT
jgi:hypothetical protein